METRVVVAGWGQITQNKYQKGSLLDPLDLMMEASRRAGACIGGKQVLKHLDGVMVVRILSRHYDGVAHLLADRIQASPRYRSVSGIGGNSPQYLVNRAAGMIARGELDSVLIAGAEAYYPRKRNKKVGENALFSGLSEMGERNDMVGATDLESRHGIYLPIHGFPLFETALWGDSGQSFNDYISKIGKRWSEFSHAASHHTHAWHRTPLSVREIVTPSTQNRRICFPYTKRMNSMISVDMGAAILLMSETAARRYRTTRKNPVYFLAGAYTQDRQRFMIEKSDFTKSPPLKAAVARALKRGRLDLDEIGCFDLYSCFPCAVSIACRMLGLGEGEKRPLTLTGGLGFFGGPGNNYSLHAIATLAQSLSEGKFQTGMVTSLGWFMHKHAVGIYTTRPGETGIARQDIKDRESYLVGADPVPVMHQANGPGVVETYTVIYERDGSPSYGVIYGQTDKGKRFVARSPHDLDFYREMTTVCLTGRSVKLRYDDGKGLNIADIR